MSIVETASTAAHQHHARRTHFALGFCRICGEPLTAHDQDLDLGPGGNECLSCAWNSGHMSVDEQRVPTLSEQLERGLRQAGVR